MINFRGENLPHGFGATHSSPPKKLHNYANPYTFTTIKASMKYEL
jgi:hypothetical protein